MRTIQAPRACGLYLPGHSVHWIQARKGREDQVDPPVPCRLVGWEGDGTVRIEVAGRELRLWNHHPDRLARVVNASKGAVSYQPRWHLLSVATSPGGRALFSVATPSDVRVACPATPPSNGPAEVLASAGGRLAAGDVATGGSMTAGDRPS